MKSLLVIAALLVLSGCNTYYVKPEPSDNATTLDGDTDDLSTQTKYVIPCNSDNCGKEPN